MRIKFSRKAREQENFRAVRGCTVEKTHKSHDNTILLSKTGSLVTAELKPDFLHHALTITRPTAVTVESLINVRDKSLGRPNVKRRNVKQKKSATKY